MVPAPTKPTQRSVYGQHTSMCLSSLDTGPSTFSRCFKGVAGWIPVISSARLRNYASRRKSLVRSAAACRPFSETKDSELPRAE
jgi:hypothetical protein